MVILQSFEQFDAHLCRQVQRHDVLKLDRHRLPSVPIVKPVDDYILLLFQALIDFDQVGLEHWVGDARRDDSD